MTELRASKIFAGLASTDSRIVPCTGSNATELLRKRWLHVHIGVRLRLGLGFRCRRSGSIEIAKTVVRAGRRRSWSFTEVAKVGSGAGVGAGAGASSAGSSTDSTLNESCATRIRLQWQEATG